VATALPTIVAAVALLTSLYIRLQKKKKKQECSSFQTEALSPAFFREMLIELSLISL
jgi:hypothetical protein